MKRILIILAVAFAAVTGVAAKGTWSYRYDIPFDSGDFAVVDGVIYYLEHNSKYTTPGRAFVIDIDGLAVEVVIPDTFDFNGVTYTVTSEYYGSPFYNKGSVFVYLNLNEDEIFKYFTEYWPNDINNTLKRLDTGPLKSIDDGFFRNYIALEEIRIPNFEYIESYTFMDCTSLKTVEMPMALEIKSETFRGCTSLESIDLHNVTTLGEGCFRDCTALTDCDIPMASEITKEAFRGCTSLKSVDLPNVTTLGEGCFRDCTSLTDCQMPVVSKIHPDAFKNCRSLEKLVFEVPVLTLCSSGMNRQHHTGQFIGCESLRELVVKGEIVYENRYDDRLNADAPVNTYDGLWGAIMGDSPSLEHVFINNDRLYQSSAITGATSLRSITIGNNCIAHLEDHAITGCDLREIHCMFPLPPVRSNINAEPIEVDKQTCVVYVPRGCRDIYMHADYWNEFANIVEDPDVEPLFTDAFGLMPKILTDGEYGYYPTGQDGELAVGLADYQYVKVSHQYFDGDYRDVPQFYNYAMNRSGEIITDIDFATPEEPVTIGDRDYAVTSVAPYAASYHTGLTSVNIGEGIRQISPFAFYRARITDAQSVTDAGAYSVILPSTLQSIGEKAFEYTEISGGSIYIKATEPPTITGDRFFTNESTRSGITLYVPAESVAAYESSPVWSDFRIMAVGSVAEVEADVADGEVEYYNLQGIRVTPDRAGIYIRRAGGEVTKVMIK